MRISDWSSDVCSSDLARQAGSNQEQGKEALHTTRLTKRSGTTTTFFGVAPSSVRITFADARARRSSSSFGVPLATVSVSRSLPLTCTATVRSEEHTSELQSLMRISYAVCCLKKK